MHAERTVIAHIIVINTANIFFIPGPPAHRELYSQAVAFSFVVFCCLNSSSTMFRLYQDAHPTD